MPLIIARWPAGAREPAGDASMSRSVLLDRDKRHQMVRMAHTYFLWELADGRSSVMAMLFGSEMGAA
jgi:hypothetical protein